jgi:hypothetical protein
MRWLGPVCTTRMGSVVIVLQAPAATWSTVAHRWMRCSGDSNMSTRDGDSPVTVADGEEAEGAAVAVFRWWGRLRWSLTGSYNTRGEGGG